MKKLATKLSPKIKAWINEEFESDRYDDLTGLFHWSNSKKNGMSVIIKFEKI